MFKFLLIILAGIWLACPVIFPEPSRYLWTAACIIIGFGLIERARDL